MSTNQMASKVWSFCNTLRDDGVGCLNQDLQDGRIFRMGSMVVDCLGYF